MFQSFQSCKDSDFSLEKKGKKLTFLLFDFFLVQGIVINELNQVLQTVIANHAASIASEEKLDIYAGKLGQYKQGLCFGQIGHWSSKQVNIKRFFYLNESNVEK